MYRHIAFLAAALLIAGWSGCWDIFRSFGNGETRIPETALTRYHPLAEGNQWTYEYWQSGIQSGPVGTFSRQVTDVRRRTATVKQTGRPALAGAPTGWTGIEHLTASDDSITSVWDHEPTIRAVPLRLPLVRGASWTETHPGRPPMRRTVVVADTTIAVPAGTFNGVLGIRSAYERTDDVTAYSIDYYAPGVGLVAIESVFHDPHVMSFVGMDLSSHLTSYTVR